jgi:predicted permease
VLRRFSRRLGALLRRGQWEQDLDDELRFHLEREIEQNISRGMSQEDARRAALRSFGGVDQVKESARDVRGIRLLEDVWADLRHGLRMMRKAPGFTAVAVLSLALGIGANTALFSVTDAVLLSALPVKEPDRLVLLEWEAGRAFRTSGIVGRDVQDPSSGRRGSSSFHGRIFGALRDETTAVSHLFAFAALSNANLLLQGQAEVAQGQYVSGGYFAALGVRALLGRTLTEEDDRPGAPPAALLSHGYWQARLGSDPAVLGKTIGINGIPFTIVGVTPPGFRGTMQVDSRPAVLVPLAVEPLLAPQWSMLQPGPGRRGAWWLHLMARLQPGATAQQAEQSLNRIFQPLALQMMRPGQAGVPTLAARDYPQLVARPGGGGLLESRRDHAPIIYRLFGVVALVLLIACANLANMQLARATTRRSEVTLRLALGAGRSRVVRQLLTESLLLSAVGGLLGVGLALAAQQVLPSFGGALFPRGMQYALGAKVLGFSLAVCLLTAVLFGLTPALRATRVDLATALKQGSPGAGGGARSRLSTVLVVGQVAMSLVLMLGAGLLLRTVHNLRAVDLGFDQQNLLLFRLNPGALGYQGARLERLYQDLFARLDALPGVRQATFGRIRLIDRGGTTDRILMPGEPPPPGSQHTANFQIARENYLVAMQIPLLRGRTFTPFDRAGAPRVAIVNQTLARRFPGGDPIGQRIGFDGDAGREVEIVGVVADSKYNLQRNPIAPLVYTPWRQQLAEIGRMSFALRVAGDPTALIPAVRRAVAAVSPGLPLSDVTTQRDQSRTTIQAESLLASLLSLFGALATLLAAIGLYGVMAYSVAQRTTELGIRMALGAAPTRVRQMVLLSGLKLAAIGIAAGALAGFALRRVVQSQLYGVDAGDPLTFILAGATLLAIAVCACWIPARRATRVDPMAVLRAG